ncbi:MAG: hypothetical protein V4446_04535, partial [Pseudomonadota bacterium]
MEDKEFHIALKCLFCGCDLKGNTEKTYESGDMLKCQECDELNDYDSLVEVAVEVPVPPFVTASGKGDGLDRWRQAVKTITLLHSPRRAVEVIRECS